MKKNLFLYILLLYVSTAFAESDIKVENKQQINTTEDYSEHTLYLYDYVRQRVIPVAIYSPVDLPAGKGIVIFSHGYDRNKGGSFYTYSYLTGALASAGYYVLSIQHEMPEDEMLAMGGNFRITRM